ncbi:DNA ligase D [Massilia atriviolacea]|uniref:DNA ligase (ATP) n=1 Tax=Massilia atriviolacea TaxID=2495579 RepID=A0A430HT35_9BURK|nr:DNA ligase D [Massilia atriviolacea]RSZ60657.1 DNA ligase D [Massilia atriviolacea]
MPDALKVYKSKRDFSITSEPAEGGEAAPDALTFVIQKHWASRLHYDFRLELDGTMKSWAVPKGPSYDTRDKRMAVHVEDHPISYASFEGTIPEKQYGAGKVIIWDKGIWQPLDDPHKGYRSGNLKFEIHGHKMRGKWVLVRMKGKGEKQEPWLLIKEKDDYAKPAAEFSVVDEMPDSVSKLPMPGAKAVKSRAKPKAGTTAPPAARKNASHGMPAQARKAALPASLAPELATLVDQPPGDPDEWIFEVKFDGYRLLARIEGKQVQLITRNGHDWTHKLEPLHKELVKLKLPDGWYDGEIVVHDENGRPDFGLLQGAFDGASTADIVYFMFDAPYFKGHDLRDAPLEARRALLGAVLDKAPSDAVRFSAEFGTDPEELVVAACKLGLEGVIGKRRDSRYVTRRSPDWIKLKCGQRQEFVIGGYTDPQGSRAGIGALLLGTHDKDGVLRYAGNVGSGFTQATLRDLKDKLSALDTDQSPFPPKSVAGRKHHWVKPTLVAEVSFAAWTSAGSIRHAVFQGLRIDKPAKGIRREVARQMEDTMHTQTDSKAQPKTRARAAAKKAEPVAPEGKLPATLKVTNGERVIDDKSGTTKLDLIRYYALVGSLMMEHLKGRPVSLVRAPSGVGGELFFQKHSEVDKLPGVKQMDQALDPDHPPMLEVGSVGGILSAAQWNVVEFHTQNATGKSYDAPNRMVFDLDPGEGVDWAAIQEAAQLMHAFLEELGLPSFLKTSGGKGLHVVVPLKGGLDWDTVKDFSQEVVRHLAATLPDRFAFKSGPKNRVGKIFIDYLRNGRGATTACAWSARVRPGLGISVPVGWDELAALKSGDQWTVKNVHTRLDHGNAPWDGYAKAAKTLTAAMKKLGFKKQ